MTTKSQRNDNFRFSFRWLNNCYIYCSQPTLSCAESDNLYLLFNLIRNIIDQLLGFIPSKARIRDGLSVDVLADLLAARL